MRSRIEQFVDRAPNLGAIYLPGLVRWRSKEKREAYSTAISMAETGDYIIPRVGSAAYFSKRRS